MSKIEMLENDEVELIQFFIREIESRVRDDAEAEISQRTEGGKWRMPSEFRQEVYAEKIKEVLSRLIDLAIKKPER